MDMRNSFPGLQSRSSKGWSPSIRDGIDLSRYLLADEAGHEWLGPEILKRYATDARTQQRCLEALQKGCEFLGGRSKL
jgi:hypothetical protein